MFNSLQPHGLYTLGGSSVHEISQASILEWVAISFSGGSSRPRDGTHLSCVSCLGKRVLLPPAPPGKPGFLDGSSGKESAIQEMQVRSLGQKDPLEKEEQPVPAFLPGNPMDRGAWRVVIHRVTKSQAPVNMHVLSQLDSYVEGKMTSSSRFTTKKKKKKSSCFQS